MKKLNEYFYDKTEIVLVALLVIFLAYIGLMVFESANKELFSNMPIDTVLTFDKCIELYRVMTGACAFGVKNFIETHNIEHKDYSIAEIIEKTKVEYGSERLVFNYA
ncbi:MAG: hypothetical protein PHT07_20865 [Paludibacter sp.]|nr:hypothetical protein [Paludibacter sp.]